MMVTGGKRNPCRREPLAGACAFQVAAPFYRQIPGAKRRRLGLRRRQVYGLRGLRGLARRRGWGRRLRRRGRLRRRFEADTAIAIAVAGIEEAHLLGDEFLARKRAI